MENVDHTTLSSSGSPERPAKVWNNHLLQSRVWRFWHHLGFCLTDTTDSALLLPPGWTSSAPKTALSHGGWYWYFYGLTRGRTLCSAGVCVTDIAPTNLQLLKTTRPLQSLSILMTSVSQWTSNLVDSLWATGKQRIISGPLRWSLAISIICIFGFMSYCRNRDLPFVIFPQLPWTF